MLAPRRFIQLISAVLTLASFLALPLAPTMAQGPPAPPGRLPPWEHDGHRPEARVGELPETVGRAATPQPTSLAWHIERVDAAKPFTDMGQRSLALDGSGYPHIAYGRNHLYYAWHDGSSWHLETVDDSQGVGRHTSLALDAASQAHISYYDQTNHDLKYARFDGSLGQGRGWQIETVDSAGNVGRHSSLALDAAGRPHISYYGNGDLKYAHFDGSAWLTETADSAGGAGEWTSLALDAAGRPHISYYSWTGNNLKYARFDGSSWQVETVDSTGYVGLDTSLALDASGRPHISYYAEWPNYGLKYARFDGTSWQIKMVDNAGMTGRHSSLALDAAGRPHISYYNSSPADLKHAYHDGSAWHLETVDSGGWVGQFTSLALDTSGWPHISYYDISNYGLKYAHFDGSAWQVETVDSGGGVGEYTSLALDTNDHPHISYCRWNTQQWCTELRYAHFDGSAWQIEAVDSAGGAGEYTSLALDSSGWPHISYCRFNNSIWNCDALKYAHFDGSAWQNETVDSAGDVGLYTSLALDASDHPHISYYNYTSQNLKYAHFDGSSWQVETVDSAGDVGLYTSLALDANGWPHISYHDATNEDLKYAYFNGTSWQIEVVDSAGDVGLYTSLALGAADQPHVSYRDDTNTDLKYAHFDGGAWLTETVDSAGAVGSFTSLALDTIGYPRISYRGGGNLRYAYYDGSTWHIEVVDSAENIRYTSLSLDAAGQPHISYYDRTKRDLKYAYALPCLPLESVAVSGPDHLPVGITALYTATYVPLTASLPIIFAWDNGATGSTAAYSWTLPGTYTPTVTATNCGGTVSASFSVTVFCQPVEGVDIAGPVALPVGQTGLYTATYTPVTATLPTITWDNDTVGPTTAYSWTLPGSYTVTATAANLCGEASGSLLVEVYPREYRIYLPVIDKPWFTPRKNP